MRVCYYGGYDRDHPRNQMIISGLRQAGAEIVECHSRHPIKLIRVISLIKQYFQKAKASDVVIIGAGGYPYLPLAWVLTRFQNIPIIFDAFVSCYENWKQDHLYIAGSGFPGAYFSAMIDRVTTWMASVVLYDTQEHVAYAVGNLALNKEKIKWVPVGAEPTPLVFKDRPASVAFKVFFAGSLLPLHGFEIILKAAVLLQKEEDIIFELVGPHLRTIVEKQSSPVGNVCLKDPVPYQAYLELLASADIALGAFGTQEKISYVIPCKVYDALAVGVPIITADTPAIRRILTNHHNAILIRPGNPDELARTILVLKRNPAMRSRLAREGKRTLERYATPELVGRRVLEICEEAA